MPVTERWTETPPSWAVPVTVASVPVLVRSPAVLVYVAPIWAYPTGFLFSLVTSMTPGHATDPHLDFRDHLAGKAVPRARLQVRFGGKVLDSTGPTPGTTAAGQPVLRYCGGHSTTSNGHPDPHHVNRWWVSPLPQAGHIDIAVWFPIPDGLHGAAQIDAGRLLSAARLSTVLRDTQEADPQ